MDLPQQFKKNTEIASIKHAAWFMPNETALC